MIANNTVPEPQRAPGSVLARVTRQAKPLPPRIVLYAAEKFGKTSWAAHAWKPIFLLTQGETGLLPLLETGRVPPVDHVPDDIRRTGRRTRRPHRGSRPRCRCR